MAINTELYEASHGTKPSRNKEDGLWIFSIGDGRGAWTRFEHTGTWAEASKAARAEAKMIGRAREIVVQP